MIEKMKMVCVVASAASKEEMLTGLRKLGVLHIAEKKAASRSVSERFSSLYKISTALADYAPKKGAKESVPVLSDEEFMKMLEGTCEALDGKEAYKQRINAVNSELERLAGWGEFSPAELAELRDKGLDFHFYRVSANDLKALAEDEGVQFIRLGVVDKMDTIAVIGKLGPAYSSAEFALPEKSISQLKDEAQECLKGIEECEKVLRESALYTASFNDQMLKAQNDENYSSAQETLVAEDELVWISGYIPESEIEKFKAGAEENKWAWAMDDVDEDDVQVPTKIKFNKVSKLIKPVFDILGILPGYREADISLWFFLFFILFFAMIIGDGGYGVLILLGTIGFKLKTKSKSDAVYLLTVLSIGTIAWGAVTGTWFGVEAAMNVPFLKALVIPSFASYPEYFGLTAATTQNAVMKFSFTIGAIQMALGSLISVKRKLEAKNLSWIADLGWLIAVVAMYLISLFLVIGENIPVAPVFGLVAVAFVLVVLFGGMSPDKTFGQGLKAGLSDAFTVFLNTISCFGNVMSYIRLFAVGMAGLAISQSFNNLGAGFSGPLLVVGAVIVFIGHALNIVMCFLSVVVHGVRLNVLEFSGQAGLEWAGVGYEPFEINEKIKK